MATEATSRELGFVFGSLGKHRALAENDDANDESTALFRPFRFQQDAHFVERAGINVPWDSPCLGYVDMNLGVSAQTEVFEERAEDGAGDGTFLDYRLAFGRLARRYQIHIAENLIYRDPFSGDELIRSDQHSWSSCPRDLRLRAFTELPSLLQSIACKARELASGVEETSRKRGWPLTA